MTTKTAEKKAQKYDEKKLESFAKTSTKVRYLASCQVSTSEIAKILNIRYQHVRNVLITPIKNPAEKF